MLLLSCLVMSHSFVTPWTVAHIYLAHQVPLSIGFSKQEYWSESPFSSPGDLPQLRFKPTSPALADRVLTTVPPMKTRFKTVSIKNAFGYK